MQHAVSLSGAAVGEPFAGRHPGIDAKLSAERHVQACGVPWTSFRAAIVYGPGAHYPSGPFIRYA